MCISARVISSNPQVKYHLSFYTLEHYKPNEVRLVFKGNVTDISIVSGAHL